MKKRSIIDKIVSVSLLVLSVVLLIIDEAKDGVFLSQNIPNINLILSIFASFSTGYTIMSFVVDEKFYNISSKLSEKIDNSNSIIKNEFSTTNNSIYSLMLKNDGLIDINRLEEFERNLYNYFNIKPKDINNTYFKIYIFTNNISVEKDFANTVWNNILYYNCQYYFISLTKKSKFQYEFKQVIKENINNVDEELMDVVINKNIHYIQDKQSFVLVPSKYTDIIIYTKNQLSNMGGKEQELKGFFCYQNGPITDVSLSDCFKNDNYYYRELIDDDAKKLIKYFENLEMKTNNNRFKDNFFLDNFILDDVFFKAKKNINIEKGEIFNCYTSEFPASIDLVKSSIISKKLECKNKKIIAIDYIKSGEDLIAIGGKFVKSQDTSKVDRNVFKLKISNEYYLCGYEDFSLEEDKEILYYCENNDLPNCIRKNNRNIIFSASTDISPGECLSINYNDFNLIKRS